MLDVIVLTKEWFQSKSLASYEPLTRVINKAYSRSHYKYGHIMLPRIDNDKFLEDLGFTDDYIMFVLLGPGNIMAQLPPRYFTKSTSVETLVEDHIPDEVANQLKVNPRMRFITVNNDFEFTPQILHCVLLTCGFSVKKPASHEALATGKCPVDHKTMAKCPVSHDTDPNTGSKCPINHGTSRPAQGKCPVAHSQTQNAGGHEDERGAETSLTNEHGKCPFSAGSDRQPVASRPHASAGKCPVAHNEKTQAPPNHPPAQSETKCPVAHNGVPSTSSVCPVTGQTAASASQMPAGHGSDDPNAVCPVTGMTAKDKALALKALPMEAETEVGGDGTQDVHLTAFTSFLRGAGPVFLDVLLEKLLNNPKTWSYFMPSISLSLVKQLEVHADCVREFGLVDFYTGKCGFVLSDKPDVFVDAKENSPFVDEIEVVKPFHVAYLERLVTREQLDKRLHL